MFLTSLNNRRSTFLYQLIKQELFIVVRYILNYLRVGKLFCPNNEIFKEELLEEAKFYQIKEMIAQLDWESVILKNGSHRSAVKSWLPAVATFSRLFRATTDGRTPEAFHRYCDNKGPTLVVIKSEEYIFGGYTSKSWQSRMYYFNRYSCLKYLA